MSDSERPPRRRGPAGPFLTAPNVISLFRVPFGGFAVWLLAEEHRTAAMIAMVAAFASDALDGAVARLGGQVSEWGKILDPLCDKLVFAVIGVSLAWFGLVPWWPIGVLIGRDLLVGFGGIVLAARRGNIPSSNVGGKLSTVLMALWMIRRAFWPPDDAQALGLGWLGFAALATLILSTIAYAIRASLEKPQVMRPSAHPITPPSSSPAPPE
jgi:cardiolipin synthase